MEVQENERRVTVFDEDGEVMADLEKIWDDDETLVVGEPTPQEAINLVEEEGYSTIPRTKLNTTLRRPIPDINVSDENPEQVYYRYNPPRDEVFQVDYPTSTQILSRKGIDHKEAGNGWYYPRLNIVEIKYTIESVETDSLDKRECEHEMWTQFNFNPRNFEGINLDDEPVGIRNIIEERAKEIEENSIFDWDESVVLAAVEEEVSTSSIPRHMDDFDSDDVSRALRGIDHKWQQTMWVVDEELDKVIFEL